MSQVLSPLIAAQTSSTVIVDIQPPAGQVWKVLAIVGSGGVVNANDIVVYNGTDQLSVFATAPTPAVSLRWTSINTQQPVVIDNTTYLRLSTASGAATRKMTVYYIRIK